VWPLDRDGKGSTENLFSCETMRGNFCISSTLTWTARFKIHQNCIKCLSTVPLSDDEVLLATTGDDGAVAFSRMTLAKIAGKQVSSQSLLVSSLDQQRTLRESSVVTSTLLIPKAHASAVTALQLLDSRSEGMSSSKKYRFVTSGNDQRLKTWLLTIDIDKPGVEGFAVSKVHNQATAVADVSSMDLVINEEAGMRGVVIAGIGLEVWPME